MRLHIIFHKPFSWPRIILDFWFGLSLLTCFGNNLKRHLAIVNVYVTVFSFIGDTYINILLVCVLYFVEFMITMYE